MRRQLKLQIIRIFRSSFRTCRSWKSLDVIDRPVFVSGTHELIQIFSPKPNSQKAELYINPVFSDQSQNQFLKCPPASPITPLNPLYKPAPKKKVSKPTHFKKQSNSGRDDEKTALFPPKTPDSTRREKPSCGRIFRRIKEQEMDVRDSFAVMKRSSDPYDDFRRSMVEMIVEKKICGAKDLENILEVFLSLNSYHHHRVIIEVFSDILDALFTNCS